MYSRCFLLVTLVALMTNSAFGGKGKEVHVDVEDYVTCLPLVFRPPHTTLVPAQRIQIFGETLQATRHHIIPFNTLSTFMNLILTESPFESGLGAYLAINVREIYRHFEENAESGAFPPVTRQRPNPTVLFLHGNTPVSFGGRSTSFDADYRMLAAFTWLPGNLFYGPPPSRRSNDPGDNFETDAINIVGGEAYIILRRIYDNMHNYINNPSQRTATNYDTIIADLTTVASARSRPYEFNQNEWVVAGVKDGKKMFRIKRDMGTLEEITTTTTTTERTDLKRAVVIPLFGDDDYLKASELVCKEFMTHFVPKFNTDCVLTLLDGDLLPLFVYSTENGHFLYGQLQKMQGWFIISVDNYGVASRVTDQGRWSNYYGVQIHLEIDGKHYLFGHHLETRYWFIQELTADGKMGRETDNSHFDLMYKAMFYMRVDGQDYLYGQAEESTIWSLRKLNPGGTMGPEVSHGRWDIFYDMPVPFKVGDKQYLSLHSSRFRTHIIREINGNNLNTLGVQKYYMVLDGYYAVVFPFSFAGNTYIFGHARHNGRYFIRKVFGNDVEVNTVGYQFTDARPFEINGYQYFYARIAGRRDWYQFHFDFNYVFA